MAYQLQRRDVSGTTGYIACVPSQGDLAAWLERLLAHPLDSHLHKYVLENLAPNDVSRLLPLLDRSGPDCLIVGALLREWLHLHPEFVNIFPGLAFRLPPVQRLFAYTPLPLLWEAEVSTPKLLLLAKAFRDNLEKAISLPPEAFQDLAGGPAAEWPAANALAEEFSLVSEVGEAPPQPAGLFWKEVEKVLLENKLSVNPEMRHESSLSPIGLLREWPVAAGFKGSPPLEGILTAYGRGMTLAQARASLRMEIIERASALPDFVHTGGSLAVADAAAPILLEKAAMSDLERDGKRFYAPCPAWLLAKYRSTPFYWFPAINAAGEKTLVPAQAVFLFANLEEPAIFDTAGSSGLGAGQTLSQARMASLLELVERDAAATTPISMDELVLVRSGDAIVQGLLDDYRSRGIFPVFQDITTEIGVPAWRCLVFGQDGIPVQATAAALSGKAALLAALTETPWPYSWATPAPYGKKSRRPAADLPVLTLESLPDYTMANHASNLRLLENALRRLGLEALYCDIGRNSLKYPVCRAFIPGLETHAEFDAIRLPSARLMASARKKFFSMD